MALENIRDLLVARINELDSGKHDVMTEAKLIIVEEIRVEVRILGIKNGTLRVATEDASASSEIRLRARELLAKINKKLGTQDIKRISVTIR